MSIQAQYPSNVLLTEFHKRARPEACENGIGELSIQDGQLQFCAEGINFSTQPATNAGAQAEDGAIPRNSRKKSRGETMFSKQQSFLVPSSTVGAERCAIMIPMCSERNSFRSAEMDVHDPLQTAWFCSSGIHTAVGHTATTSTGAGANVNTASCRSLLGDTTLRFHMCQQQAEIDQLITSHGEQLKQALEQKRQQHTRALLEIVDYSVLSHVKERLGEIEKVRRRNAELEEYVNKLSLESQVWMNIAQSQEALVISLRSNLEQVVAQSNEKNKPRLGESDAEDAESCVYGGSPANGDANLQAQAIRQLKEQRNCRFCRRKDISVLLLPCRHLCLCTDCDSTVGKCPICGSSKDASLQVYLD